MFFKIVISLGLIFLVDYTLGNCGLCLENHIACHSENTFSLCVGGKPTDSLVRCPNDSICTNDPEVCVRKSNDELKPSCITKNVPENFGNSYKAQKVASLTFTEDRINRALSDEETDIPSPSSEAEEEGSSPSTQNSDTSTVDPIVTEVSEEPSSTDDSDSDSSPDTTLTDEGITLITDDLSSTTEVTESVELSTSSTEDMSTTDIESLSSTSTPRDATTFCSEMKNVGTYKAEGDNTCKCYYVCTTNGDGFKGYEFNCGEKYYFNSETSFCQEEKPDDC